jgi:C-terminal processing protease CtpA/Prc
VPVEKVVERTVVQEVEVIREVPVPVEKIVEKIVTKEVPVERTIYKELSHELYIERERYEELQQELRRMRLMLEEERSRNSEVRERVVTKEVPVDRVVYKEVPVEVPVERIVEKVVYRDPPVVYRDPPQQQYVQVQQVQRAVPSPPATSTRMVGLGLALQRHNSDRQTFVEQIIPGFAAHKSNQFQINDVVIAVDQTNVEELDLDAIRELTVGPEGTFCTLQLMRGSRCGVAKIRPHPCAYPECRCPNLA